MPRSKRQQNQGDGIQTYENGCNLLFRILVYFIIWGYKASCLAAAARSSHQAVEWRNFLLIDFWFKSYASDIVLLEINSRCRKCFMCLAEPNEGLQLRAKQRFGFLWCSTANKTNFFSLFLCCPAQRFVWHEEVWGSCGEKTPRSHLHNCSQTCDWVQSSVSSAKPPVQPV